MTKPKKNEKSRPVDVKDLESRQNPKGGGISNLEKARQDSSKGAINNIKP